MPAKDSGIYVGVNFDLDPLATDINVVKSQLKTAGKEFSDVLDKAINTTKATKSIEKLTDSVAVLARMPKSVNFTPTINGLDAVAEKAGISKQRIEGLYGAMVKTSAAKAHEDALKNIQKQAGLSTIQMAKLRYELGDTSGAFKAMGAAALPVVGTIAAVGASALYMGKACFDAGLQLDRMNKVYTSITGSSQGAAVQLDYMYSVTDKLGLQFQTTAESAKGLFAAGAGTSLEKDLNGIFEGVSTAASALSLSQDQVSRTFVALGQMISKGKVSSEELRQQFGEHIPSALDLASKAMGVSTAQLNKMMERGELLAEDLLPKLGLTMREDFGAGSVEAAKGAQAAVNKLSSEWVLFKAQILDVDPIITAINSIADALKDVSKTSQLRSIHGTFVQGAKLAAAGKLADWDKFTQSAPAERQRIVDAILAVGEAHDIAENQRVSGIRATQHASDEAAKRELENNRKITDAVTKYTGTLKENRLAQAEADYTAISSPLQKMIDSGKGDTEKWKKMLADATKVYEGTVKKINEEGKKGASSGVSHLNAYTAELDKTMSSVTALKAQLEAPAGDMFTLNQVKINKDYDQTLIAINKQVKEYEGKKGISKAQAHELETAKLLEAQHKKDLALRDLQNKNAEIRLDFEKRYADMVGATSQGIVESIRKQSAEYASAGADRVRLAEWERDQIQRASTAAWDGAAVALRDYSAEAGNQAKGMNEAFTGLFTGIDSGFGNMWSQMLEDGKVSLSEFRKLFANFMADLLHMAITRPITVSIAGVVSGALGFSTGTAQAAQQAAGGGGFSIPNLPISSLLPDSVTSGFSSLMGWNLPGTYSSSVGLTSGSLSTSALQGASNLPAAGSFTGSAGGFGLGSALGYGAMGSLGYACSSSGHDNATGSYRSAGVPFSCAPRMAGHWCRDTLP